MAGEAHNYQERALVGPIIGFVENGKADNNATPLTVSATQQPAALADYHVIEGCMRATPNQNSFVDSRMEWDSRLGRWVQVDDTYSQDDFWELELQKQSEFVHRLMAGVSAITQGTNTEGYASVRRDLTGWLSIQLQRLGSSDNLVAVQFWAKLTLTTPPAGQQEYVNPIVKAQVIPNSLNDTEFPAAS